MLTNIPKNVKPQIDALDMSPILMDANHGHESEYSANEHFTDTPLRVRRAWKEMLSGVYTPMPQFVLFRNKYANDTVHEIKDIKVISVCAHHLLPVFCKLDIAIMFGESLLGLSKYSRLAKWVFGRPGVQEDLIEELADQIVGLVKPKGLRIKMEAVHTCMSIRGVEQKDASFHSETTRGVFSSKELITAMTEDMEKLFAKEPLISHAGGCGCEG